MAEPTVREAAPVPEPPRQSAERWHAVPAWEAAAFRCAAVFDRQNKGCGGSFHLIFSAAGIEIKTVNPETFWMGTGNGLESVVGS